VTLPTDVHNIFANPVDDLLFILIGLCLRLFIKTDKFSVRIAVYLLPLVLKYIKRYYSSGYMHEKISHLEAEVSLIKKRIKLGKIEMLG
jgi:hypothetical protein